MSTPQGHVLMTTLAVGPPAIGAAAYLLQWGALTHMSIAAKTLCALAYAYVMKKAVIYYFFTSPFRHKPTPDGANLLVGHVLRTFEGSPGEGFLRMMNEVPNDGFIVFQGWLHCYPNILLTSPELCLEVLNTHAADWEKMADGRAFLARIIGNGLVVVEGSEHREQRKNIAPAFSGRAIKDLVPLFWSKGMSLARAAKREAGVRDGTVDIMELASRATLDIIGSAGLGKDFASLEDSEHEVVQVYSEITDPRKGSLVFLFVITQLFPLWLGPLLPLPANWRLNRATAGLRRIMKKLLSEKSEDMQKKGEEQKDLIAMLMRSGKFSDDGLTDQLLTFLAAGHETTAGAMTWSAYLISKHTDVQDRLRKECQDVCGNADVDTITAEMIDSMHYLDAVCNEVLRVYPLVANTSRISVRPTQVGGMVFPKDTAVVISPWALNRLPALWGHDAEEFRPERWMGPEGKHGGAKSPYAFMTFIYGPRTCIGASFARSELKCLLATLLMHFELRLKKPDEVPVPSGAITIKPKDGMEIIVTEIKSPI
ncbi:hypothetical protein LTR53_003755 [Teratosphaeriaceae sp. CCFEE 6253]|nr:hypothetical protein LTR53_003755 [Teratosphaeriaceae sp. CCFEE 6253]